MAIVYVCGVTLAVTTTSFKPSTFHLGDVLLMRYSGLGLSVLDHYDLYEWPAFRERVGAACQEGTASEGLIEVGRFVTYNFLSDTIIVVTEDEFLFQKSARYDLLRVATAGSVFGRHRDLIERHSAWA